MKILILGDVHGCWDATNATIRRAFEDTPGGDFTHIFQVGDFGHGWPHCHYGPHFNLHPDFKHVPFHWLDGNHEHFPSLREGKDEHGLIYQPRGSVIEIEGHRILFMGGAHSIDHTIRTPGVDWWPDENITLGQLDEVLDRNDKIDTVFSHDAPTAFTFPPNERVLPDGRHNRIALEHIRVKYNPSFWFHGHYHWGWHHSNEGTEFACCPIIESYHYTVFDGEKIERSWENPFKWR